MVFVILTRDGWSIMKKIIFLIMLLFAFSENAFSQIYDYRAYKAWAAYVVTGQNAQPIVRMATSYNTGLTLVLDFFPDNTYFMALSEPTNSFLPSSNLLNAVVYNQHSICL